MDERRVVVAWALRELYDNDLQGASKATGFTVQQLTAWRDGTYKPQKKNISRLMHPAFEPDFAIIAEFKPIKHDGTIEGVHGELSKILRGFHKASGVYAFYDSSGSLLYLGKADGRLLNESYQRIRTKLTKAALPKVARQPKTWLPMVRYISAYKVNKSDIKDYAKHAEALMLRISKPPLNTNSGKLDKAKPDRGSN
jgi:hypothetical protein